MFDAEVYRHIWQHDIKTTRILPFTRVRWLSLLDETSQAIDLTIQFKSQNTPNDHTLSVKQEEWLLTRISLLTTTGWNMWQYHCFSKQKINMVLTRPSRKKFFFFNNFNDDNLKIFIGPGELLQLAISTHQKPRLSTKTFFEEGPIGGNGLYFGKWPRNNSTHLFEICMKSSFALILQAEGSYQTFKSFHIWNLP